MSAEETELKFLLGAMLSSLGKQTSERDLRRAYRDEEGHDVDVQIRKLGAGSLVNFLRSKCSSICFVIQDEIGVKIVRKSTENSKHMDYMTKSQNRKKSRAKNMAKKFPK